MRLQVRRGRSRSWRGASRPPSEVQARCDLWRDGNGPNGRSGGHATRILPRRSGRSVVSGLPQSVPWPALRRSGSRHRQFGPVAVSPPPPYVLRLDLGGTAPVGPVEPLVAFAHLTDLHVTDAQSPARAEYLDRLGDDDSPVADRLGPVGTYRPQEPLTCHVVEAMVRAVRRIDRGPVLGAPLDMVWCTGDAVDNAQRNELDAVLGLLTGAGPVVPDSGSLDGYHGVGTAAFYDQRYWHPDGSPAGAITDRPRSAWGFPVVPGLHAAARLPFAPTGIGLPVNLAVGNHDRLLAGTVPPSAALAAIAAGGRKTVGLPAGVDAYAMADILAGAEQRPPELVAALRDAPWTVVPADARRRPLVLQEWWSALRQTGGRSARAASCGAEALYYAVDHGPVRFVVLDTSNPEGGWQGSVDEEQMAWLHDLLVDSSTTWIDEQGRRQRARRERRHVVLVSHHPLATLVNRWSSRGRVRSCADDVLRLISRFPDVVAWINGHTHVHRVTALPPAAGPGGIWQITTASHVDWPQQARVVEIGLDASSGQVVIATTAVDHAGAVDPRHLELGDVLTLAGWSRTLAANHWSLRGEWHASAARNAGGRPDGGPDDEAVGVPAAVGVVGASRLVPDAGVGSGAGRWAATGIPGSPGQPSPQHAPGDGHANVIAVRPVAW